MDTWTTAQSGGGEMWQKGRESMEGDSKRKGEAGNDGAYAAEYAARVR